MMDFKTIHSAVFSNAVSGSTMIILIFNYRGTFSIKYLQMIGQAGHWTDDSTRIDQRSGARVEIFSHLCSYFCVKVCSPSSRQTLAGTC